MIYGDYISERDRASGRERDGKRERRSVETGQISVESTSGPVINTGQGRPIEDCVIVAVVKGIEVFAKWT